MNQQERKSKIYRRFDIWQIMSAALMVYDFMAVCGAYFFALFLYFDFVYSSISQHYIEPYNKFILPYAAGCIVVFLAVGMYNNEWRYFGYTAFVRTLTGLFLTSAATRC